MKSRLLGLACCALLAGCGGGSGVTPTGPSPAITGPRLSKTRFLAFGDSLTLGEISAPIAGTALDSHLYQAPTLSNPLVIVPSAAYPTLLQSQLTTTYRAQASSIVVINAGKPGEHPHEGKKRLRETCDWANPDVVLLMEGANSLHLYGTDLPTDALAEMTIELRERGIRVFVSNLTPTRPDRRLSQPLIQLLSINRKLEAMAAERGAVFVNLYDAMLDDADRFIGDDGLHPTEAGYKRIADLFFAAIRSELEVK